MYLYTIVGCKEKLTHLVSLDSYLMFSLGKKCPQAVPNKGKYKQNRVKVFPSKCVSTRRESVPSTTGWGSAGCWPDIFILVYVSKLSTLIHAYLEVCWRLLSGPRFAGRRASTQGSRHLRPDAGGRCIVAHSPLVVIRSSYLTRDNVYTYLLFITD